MMDRTRFRFHSLVEAGFRNPSRQLCRAAIVISCLAMSVARAAADDESFRKLGEEYSPKVRQVIQRFCLECHSTAVQEGELDLESVVSIADVRRTPTAWQKVAEVLDRGEMPPKDSPQPPPELRAPMRDWVQRYLRAEALASAGDPGRVVLRRLSNVEYTNSIRDLTRVPLNPAHEFPVDGAAGEGFTNSGESLVMSSGLLTKYLDAAKEIAAHAVPLADGLRFSPSATRRDWTDEIMTEIRKIYGQYADKDGHLPLEPYLAATIEHREDLTAGTRSFAQIAAQHKLSPKYLELLWKTLTAATPSPVLDSWRAKWRVAKPADAAALAAEIKPWQQALTRFNTVGLFFYTLEGPTVKKSWQEPIDPLVNAQEFRHKFPASSTASEAVVYLAASEAGDASSGDTVLWKQPRLEQAGQPALLLRDVPAIMRRLGEERQRLFAATAKYLAAADEVRLNTGPADLAAVAQRHQLEPASLVAWLDYLGIAAAAPTQLKGHLSDKIPSASNHNFIQGWGKLDTPLLFANSSDQEVHVPGLMKPHSVAVHPGPQVSAAIGWQSPIEGDVRIEARVVRAHPECGNGVTWTLELRRGQGRTKLASAVVEGREATVAPIDSLQVRRGDVVSLLIGPRDGNHACDLTEVDFTVSTKSGEERRWNLAADVANDVLVGNPHPDRQGNPHVWHFYTEAVSAAGPNLAAIPQGSLLSRWLATEGAEERIKLGAALQKLLTNDASAPADQPDAQLHKQLTALDGPLLSPLIERIKNSVRSPEASTTIDDNAAASLGLKGAQFGKRPDGGKIGGSEVDAASLCVAAPSVLELRIPAALVAGRELVVTGSVDGGEGSVQLFVTPTKPTDLTRLQPGLPIVAAEGGAARQRVTAALDELRNAFPEALCYSQIVPVDEVVTLVQFFRDDERLGRLMLEDSQRAKLDELWDELRFVSQDALQIREAYGQFMEFTTQDRNPEVYKPLRKPIFDHAEAFQKRLIETEPKQLDAALEFARRAFRRPLTDAETGQLRAVYKRLRTEDLSHDEALRLVLARILISPAFLYRAEKASEGNEPRPVSDFELASRLSYFLGATAPDEELQRLAAAGKLSDPQTLVAQSRRLLQKESARNLATEFACQWLDVRDFHEHDEKSDRHFPTFAALRSDMYEESVRFFTDMFQRDGSVLDVLTADHTFLNEALAAHYGIPGVKGAEWRRVDGVRKYSRGGVLGMSTTLAKQSGASRTSPILRGNWVVETLLGEKLPKPPKDVPLLPEDETATNGLTVRQLVEKHSNTPQCAVCHVRMDPFGFALEGFDAIGRFRERDLADRPIDAQATFKDGVQLNGFAGLRDYLSVQRKDQILRNFCRKLLGYALGRSVQLSDEPLLDDMLAQLQQRDYRFSAAIETLVLSKQFRFHRAVTQDQETKLGSIQ